MRSEDFSVRDFLIHGIFFNLYGIVKYFPPPVGSVLRYAVSKLFVHKMGRVRLYEGVTLWYPHKITMGTGITLNEWVYISGYGGLSIGDRVRIGHGTTILTSDHVIPPKGQRIIDAGLAAAPVVVEEDVFIGANVTVLKGVTIGAGSVVAAGAVVTRDVEPCSIVAGVPARQVGVRDEKAAEDP